MTTTPMTYTIEWYDTTTPSNSSMYRFAGRIGAIILHAFSHPRLFSLHASRAICHHRVGRREKIRQPDQRHPINSKSQGHHRGDLRIVTSTTDRSNHTTTMRRFLLTTGVWAGVPTMTRGGGEAMAVEISFHPPRGDETISSAI